MSGDVGGSRIASIGGGPAGPAGPTGPTGPTGGMGSIVGATVSTTEVDDGTGYGDLATPGPSVTLTSTGTIAIVWISATIIGTSTQLGFNNFVSVAVSGATTIGAADVNASNVSNPAQFYAVSSMRAVILAITPGTNTYELKYRVSGQSWTAGNRTIAVFAP